jgi:hypothetical protein
MGTVAPVILEGPNGEQFHTYTSQRYDLGTQLIFQDGRKYRFAEKSGAAAVAGFVQQAAANVANHIGQTMNTVNAVNAREFEFLVGATAVTANDYDEGYLSIDDGTGEGYIYRIATHDASAGSENITLNLEAGESVQVATAAAGTIASILKNPYKDVVVYPTTATQVHVGVAVKPIAANGFGWLQTRGPASIMTNGTVILGDAVYVAATTAGTVSATTTTFAVEYQRIVGYVMKVSATTLESVVFVTIDG